MKSRYCYYRFVIQAAQKRAARPAKAQLAEALIIRYGRRLADHRCFIDQHEMEVASFLRTMEKRLSATQN